MSPSSTSPSLRSVYHPQHQHHGPRQSLAAARQQQQQSFLRPPPPPLTPHSAIISFLSLLHPHHLIRVTAQSTTLCALIHHLVLLALAAIIAFGALLPPSVLAHAPPRASYYEVTSNPVRSLLASAHFGRLPVSPYYGFGSSRRYGSSSFKDPSSSSSFKMMGNSGKTANEEEVKAPRVRPFTDEYYAYTHEPQHEAPLPIPSCKELRIMWLANKFARHHATYRENHHKGWEWVRQIPEISKLLDSVLQSQRTNKLQQQSSTSDSETVSTGQYGTIKTGTSDDQVGFGQVKQEPPVYIAKIVPSRDNIEQMQAEKPTLKEETTFGIIHTSPDDGEDDQEELVVGSSIRQPPTTQDKQSPSSQKGADIESEVRVDRNGNRAIFGKFIDNNSNNNNADREKTRGTSVLSRPNLGKPDRDIKMTSVSGGSMGSRAKAFQSSQTSRSMPGVWHNKPVVPSVRMVRDTNIDQP